MNYLSDKVLVLNKNYYPHCVVTVEDAIKLTYLQKAVIMDGEYNSYTLNEWEAKTADSAGTQKIRTKTKQYLVPEIIRLIQFDEMIKRLIKPTRQNVFIRDKYTCQYCGATLNKDSLTIDHVIPRSRQVEFRMSKEEISSWHNVVTSCRRCNVTKDNLTPQEADMKLLHPPRLPLLSIEGFDYSFVKSSWNNYFFKYNRSNNG
jgi:5-methylcytosine-specific restriction endonuclease McrA